MGKWIQKGKKHALFWGVLLCTSASFPVRGDEDTSPKSTTSFSAARLLESLGSLPAIEEIPVGTGAPLRLRELIENIERYHPIMVAAEQRVLSAEGLRLSAEGAFDLILGARSFLSMGGYYEYGRLDIGWTQPTPVWGITLNGGWRIGRNLGGGGIPEYYRYHETLDAGELRLGFTLPLWRDGAIDSRRASLWRAEHAVRAAQAERDARRLRLFLLGAEAYFRWVAAGLRYLVVRELLRIAEERDAQIAARARAGAIPLVEHLENRRVILERRQALISARRLLEQRAIALSLYYRGPDGSPRIPGPERLPRDIELPMADPKDREADISMALERRPELQRFSAQRRALEVSMEFAQNQLAPRVDLSLLAAADLGGPGVSEPERAADIQKRLGPPNVDIMLNIELPLFFREARGRVEQARADLAALDAEAELARDQIGIEVEDALSAIRAARENLAIAEESVRVARLVADAERARFEAGATSLLIVNLREAAAAAAEQLAIDARADLALALVGWIAATGGRF
ncbi:MAG: TolC family protein [Sandaracinaceae bacterium]|nr:TolC family protein [Sandaracinaceae bacterium]MDW8247188.1 TolC family protein [Sandaracinaceae bacterium]